MPDDEPLSTTVSETVTTETNADPETVKSLNSAFDDFWHSEDSKTADDAPAAPTGQEPQKKAEAREPVSEVKPITSAKEYTDDEIDRLALTKSERPEAIEDFKQLKAGWKAERAKAKAEAERASKLEQELTQARQNSWTPEQRADYEHAAAIRRKFDFASDPDFIQQFHAPIRTRYEQILDEAVLALPDRDAAQAWANYMKQNYQPDQLDRNWWQHSVLAKVPDELDRDALRSSITEMNKLQKARDSEIQNRTNDQSAFNNWIQEKTQHTQQRIQEEIMTEISTQEKRIQEVLPRDVNQAKTAEERRAIEDHNERFTRLNTFFQDTMKDLSKNGPRAWVRASVEATRAQLLEGEYKEMEKELKSTKAERDQLKAELDKIAGARRRISHTSGTPPASSGKDKSNGGLSIKDLDIRKSFEKFDWGDST